MNESDYILSNLNMISRIALLENAPESRKAIDRLIAILRYNDQGEILSTLADELGIANKMFDLFRSKKRDAFNGIIIGHDIGNTCYIKKGCVLDIIKVALNKKLKNDQDQLEIKVVTKVYEGHVEVIVQDNGEVDENIADEKLGRIYDRLTEDNKETPISVTVKKGVGTKVIISIPMN